MRLLEGLDELGGSLYRQSRSIPRRAEIGSANRRSVACRTTWRRRALVDELADKLGLLQRRAGERLWLGRCRPWQGPAAHAGVPPRGSDGGAVGRQGEAWSALMCGRGRAWLCRRARARGGTRSLGCACAKHALWARPEHARQALDEMTTRDRGLHIM